jgi:hypothetical protein
MLHPHCCILTAAAAAAAAAASMQRVVCRHLSEEKARWLFQQLIFAVDYCHRKGTLRRVVSR